MTNSNNFYKLYGIENINVRRFDLGTKYWDIEHLNYFLEDHNGKIIDIHFVNNRDDTSTFIPQTYVYVVYIDENNDLEEVKE